MKKETKLKMLKNVAELQINRMVDYLESEYDEAAIKSNPKLEAYLDRLKKLKEDVLNARSVDEINEVYDNITKGFAEPSAEKKKDARVRTIFKVVFPDGKTIDGKTGAEVFVSAISYIGEEKIAPLDLMFCKMPVVCQYKKVRPRCIDNYKSCSKGWYVWTPGSTKQKIMLLEKIAKLLNIKIVIQQFDVEPSKSADKQ